MTGDIEQMGADFVRRLADGIAVGGFASLAQEAADQEKAIVGIVSICDISYEQARERFAAYCATQPYSWRTCWARILAGNTEALAYLRGEHGHPSA